MKKQALYIALLILLPLTLLITKAACDSAAQDKLNTEYLASLGWETGGSIEEVSVHIPEEFDDVYENYNSLQLECGFDLKKYRGADCTRYTYQIKNFPGDDSGEVRANILVFDRRIIGGDIMTVRLDGFMIGLAGRNELQTATGIFLSKVWYL